MKKNDKLSTLSVSSSADDHVGKHAATKKAQDEFPSANDLGQEIDRAGVDLDGSSDDTHAGTGLGLGKDAFDTAGERRLPGRRLDNDLTIPRWGGSKPRETIASDEETAGAETLPTPKKKKAH